MVAQSSRPPKPLALRYSCYSNLGAGVTFSLKPASDHNWRLDFQSAAFYRPDVGHIPGRKLSLKVSRLEVEGLWADLASAGFPGKPSKPIVWDHCCYNLRVETDLGVDEMRAAYCHGDSEEKMLEAIRQFLHERIPES